MSGETPRWSMREAYIREHGPVPRCTMCGRCAVSNECMESMCPAPWMPPPASPSETTAESSSKVVMRYSQGHCSICGEHFDDHNATLCDEIARLRADAELGALLRAALATVRQGYGLMVYPDNVVQPVNVRIWDGLFTFTKNAETESLARALAHRGTA